MSIKWERRELISSPMLDEELRDNPEKWIAFECVDTDVGGIFWKVLLMDEGKEPVVVVTTRLQIRTIRSGNGVVTYFRDHYPDAPFLDLPVKPGEIAPRRHPLRGDDSQ